MFNKLLWSIPLRVCENSIFFPLEHNNGGRVCPSAIARYTIITHFRGLQAIQCQGHDQVVVFCQLSQNWVIIITLISEYPGITLSWSDAI